MMNPEEFDEIVATCDLYRQMTGDPAAAINLFSALMQLSDWNSEIQDEIQKKTALPYRKMTTTHLTNAGRS